MKKIMLFMAMILGTAAAFSQANGYQNDDSRFKESERIRDNMLNNPKAAPTPKEKQYDYGSDRIKREGPGVEVKPREKKVEASYTFPLDKPKTSGAQIAK